jgi:uncharacterized protein
MRSAFVDLSAQECRDRIAAGGVGRVAFCGPDGPELYPVNFAVVDAHVVFRVAPYTRLGTGIDGRPVVFEVDDLDAERRSGWSVVVKGTARAVDDPDEVVSLRRRGPEPWAPGQRQQLVRVSTLRVSGRHVVAG